MNNEKEKWIDEVFDSWEGSQRATPNDALFRKIEKQVKRGQVVSMGMRRVASIAAAILIIFNVFAIQQSFKTQDVGLAEEMVEDDSYGSSLIVDYKLYD